MAGTWQPVADADVTAQNHGLAVDFAGNLRLHNGREGLVFAGWSFAGFSNADPRIIPVHAAILEQQEDGVLRLATSKYVTDASTNGAGSVVVADFNRDGVDDVFLATWNEAPNIASSSTAFVSNRDAYDRIPIKDFTYAHGAYVTEIDGQPTVFTATYYNAPGRGNTVARFDGVNDFSLIQNTGTGGTSSVAVADFYGNGNYSAVYGDMTWGPSFPYDAAKRGIYIYNLRNLLPTGGPTNVGRPYFDDKPQYANFPSFWDPHKSHSYRVWVDDFNQDRKMDILVQNQIWNERNGLQKDMLQMFQNELDYRFKDVTSALNPEYDEDCYQHDYQPQLRDVDGSGIKAYFFASPSDNKNKIACNYIFVNDGTGRLGVAMHETLNRYGDQVLRWLRGRMPAGYSAEQPPLLRAYRTPNGKFNFLAVTRATLQTGSAPYVNRYVMVNVPVQLDLAAQFTQPIVVTAQNGSRHIRTFAGDDVIYASGEGGATIDGGPGFNTVVYPQARAHYSLTSVAEGAWRVVSTNTTTTDTLVRIQRVEFRGEQ